MSEEEPWKDADTLRELYQDRTQSQVAEYFQQHGHDVTASTISYWMKKLEVNTSHTKHDNERDTSENRKCVNFEDCGNRVPGANNSMCAECLDRVRTEQREREIANDTGLSYA